MITAPRPIPALPISAVQPRMKLEVPSTDRMKTIQSTRKPPCTKPNQVCRIRVRLSPATTA
ncbi:hypothetical protein A5N15_07660 [Rothia kristinae]|uniref:Uncharacterized protein n=1 Tax=Rothia kristinae TaxID=37923 RepID=A0A657IUR2_9MICC|nr:hypothetical protein A5N15_07660 [Rothia kristinae]